MRGEKHVDAGLTPGVATPPLAQGLLDDLVVVLGSILGSAGVQRRIDGLLHNVNGGAPKRAPKLF